jgi:hypothetical protein
MVYAAHQMLTRVIKEDEMGGACGMHRGEEKCM